jgi:hypothetical protein
MQTWQFLYFLFNKYIKYKNRTFWSFYLYGRFETGRFETFETSAWIYRPAFSWKQAQNARIHLIENERFGWFSRKQGL